MARPYLRPRNNVNDITRNITRPCSAENRRWTLLGGKTVFLSRKQRQRYTCNTTRPCFAENQRWTLLSFSAQGATSTVLPLMQHDLFQQRTDGSSVQETTLTISISITPHGFVQNGANALGVQRVALSKWEVNSNAASPCSAGIRW